MKILDITLDIWKWQGCVLVGGTSKDFAAFAKKYIDADITIGDHAAGHCYVGYGKPWLIWIQTLKDVPCLAHEALHATAGILEARGLKHGDQSEEAYTYTMEFIVRSTLDAKPRDWKKA